MIGMMANVGNTKNIRVKNYCFTWNNYEKDDIKRLLEYFGMMGSQKYVFQEEKGENKTKHLQGYVGFNRAVRFDTLKKFNEKIHWERCRNVKQSIEYCMKVDTRVGEVYTKGIEKPRRAVIDPLGDKKLKDWQKEVIEIIKQKADDRSVYWFLMAHLV